METIKKTLDDGLIHSGVVSYKAFEKALKLGKDQCLEELKEKRNQWSLDDIHKSMSWWACFQNDESDDFSDEAEDLYDYFEPIPKPSAYISSKSKKKAKAKKKKKRKLAKKSRRKNR